jgi:hypothetical protein
MLKLRDEVIAKAIKGTWSSSQDSISELNPEILTDCILEAGNKVFSSSASIDRITLS